MTEQKSGKQIVRQTLEGVFQAQEKLRKHLDCLIDENRPLQDSRERDLFFRELVYSTLGLGREQIVHLYVGSFDGLRADLETVCRWLAYQDKSMVLVPMELRDMTRGYCPQAAEAPIRDLWRVVRDNLFSVFPRSIDRATSLSKEQDAAGKTRGYVIADE